ncbi:MAG: DNA gyrase inhibitor YacG [Tropicimonas sp.]|uniref:DNA gyrase inhibitor YacG n=1 Tax=Tropicimonas sp. TaxID=2067044 RepID=UPI003A89FCFA
MSCPVCGKDAAAKYRPFCSKRCADIDLGRWLNGSYAIPTDEPADPGLPPDPDTPPTRH